MSDIFQSPFERAILGLFLGIGLGFVIGIGGFGDSWQEATFSATGSGIGFAFVFYSARNYCQKIARKQQITFQRSPVRNSCFSLTSG